MRIAGDTESSRELQPQMTPMVDVVFLLLIFFLLATHIVLNEVLVRGRLQSLAGDVSARLSQETATVVVYLDHGEQGLSVRVGNVSCSTFDDLRHRLADIALPDLPVLIVTDPTLPFHVLARGIDARLAEGYQNLSLGWR